MTSPSTIDEYAVLPIRDGIVREDDPARPVRIRTAKLPRSLAHGASGDRIVAAPVAPPLGTAANRQNAQLPAFAPLLEELEVAGWSSHRRTLSGNFHDWMLLDGRTLLVMAGQAVPMRHAEVVDPIEAALGRSRSLGRDSIACAARGRRRNAVVPRKPQSLADRERRAYTRRSQSR